MFGIFDTNMNRKNRETSSVEHMSVSVTDVTPYVRIAAIPDTWLFGNDFNVPITLQSNDPRKVLSQEGIKDIKDIKDIHTIPSNNNRIQLKKELVSSLLDLEERDPRIPQDVIGNGFDRFRFLLGNPDGAATYTLNLKRCEPGPLSFRIYVSSANPSSTSYPFPYPPPSTSATFPFRRTRQDDELFVGLLEKDKPAKVRLHRGETFSIRFSSSDNDQLDMVQVVCVEIDVSD
jgi:hypothetical protein